MTEKETEMRMSERREGADDEFRPQLINLLCVYRESEWTRVDDDVTLDSCRQTLARGKDGDSTMTSVKGREDRRDDERDDEGERVRRRVHPIMFLN